MIDCLRAARALLVGCVGVALAGAFAACGPSGPPPSFRLVQPSSDPDAGSAMVTTQEMGGSYYAPITVEATGLMLAEAMHCNGMDRCGHVVINVDDNACNTMGQMFNTSGGTAMLQANMSLCPQITGPHTVRAEFVRDDGTSFPMPYVATGRMLVALAGAGPFNGAWTGTINGSVTTTEPTMNTEMIMNRTGSVTVNTPDRAREDMTITLQTNSLEFWAVDAARNGTTATIRLHDYMGRNNDIPVTYTVTAATIALMPIRVGTMMSTQMTYTLALTFTTQNLMMQTVRGTAMYTFVGTPG